MDYFLLFSGFVLLMVGGDLLVKGSVSMAGHFKVSKLVIGVVVVSFGTSAPELIVSIDAAILGHPDITIGNVIGSNIANIALILGLSAVIMPLYVKNKAVHYDWSIMMFTGILLYIFSIDLKLVFYEGLVLLIILLVYIFWSVYKSRKENKKSAEVVEVPKLNLLYSISFVVLASVLLIYGARFLVKGASSIALKLGVGERAISVSVIAFGTSLPELATSIIAALRKEHDIFIGNIIGSNIFNILCILGISGMITTIKVNPMVLGADIFWMLGISVLLFLFILPLKKGFISRWKGLAFVLLYIVYIYTSFTV